MLVDDRPEIGDFLKESEGLAQWLIRRFQSDAERRLYWDHREPINDAVATYIPEKSPYPSLLRVTSRASMPLRGRLPASEKFAHIAHQLYALDDLDAYEQNQRDVVSGELTKEDFTSRSLDLTFRAIWKTKRLFDAHKLLPEEPEAPGLIETLILIPDSYAEFTRLRDSNRGEIDGNALEDYVEYYKDVYQTRYDQILAIRDASKTPQEPQSNGIGE